MSKSKVALAYCAGIVDGEGSIYISRRVPGRRRKSLYYESVIAVNMTSPKALRVLVKTFGGHIHIGKRKTDAGKTIYNWRFFALNAERVIRALLPYLRVKKPQALLALRFRRHVRQKSKTFHHGETLSGHTLTKRDLALRERFYQQSKELND